MMLLQTEFDLYYWELEAQHGMYIRMKSEKYLLRHKHADYSP